ncbi:alpha/beta hydrolase [Polaribacter sp. R77954]|uniref:alpha/beta hydrolase n=1 Tax=Polaribacter sp. R77954 TaxID=3093870 RepID=UPI0037C77DB0
MSKTHIYLMPGLAAGPEIFENLELSKKRYELHYLTWLPPLSLKETVANYAMRISDMIIHKNPVLVGVSFGGIIVQEMSKFINVQKIIIISSVKSKNELPKRFKIAAISKIYKLFPTTIVTNFENYAKYFVGKSLERKAKLYKKYLSVRNKEYIKWSIHNAINWNQDNPMPNIIHIHGTKDEIFPIKSIQNCIRVKNGNHSMIIIKAKEISKIIDESLTC